MTKLSKEDRDKIDYLSRLEAESGYYNPECDNIFIDSKPAKRKDIIEFIEAYANQQREEERKKNLTECIRLRKSLKGVGGETELLATAIVNQIMRYIKLSFNYKQR